MDLLNKFQKHISTKQFFREGDRLLLAVSGGMDSVCMCELMMLCGYRFSVAHVNYQLRGEESEGDELFVKNWCEKNQIAFYLKKVDTKQYAEVQKTGIQEAARNLRYEWFEELATQFGFNKILTAHHAGDNLETLLHHFFRGTGLNGLTGIKERRGVFIRPLLFTDKEQIRNFVVEKNIAYREDSSNATNKYTRNFLRHDILPLLKKQYPSIENNILDNLGRFSSLAAEIERHVDKKIRKLEWKEGGSFKYPASGLLRSEFKEQVLLQLLGKFGGAASQLPELLKLLTADSGKYVFSKTHRFLKDRKWVIVTPKLKNEEGPFLIEENETKISTADGELELKKVGHFKSDADANMETINASNLEYPLIFRRWRTGDYFYPLGMKHKKKLSRFFIDQKLSVAEKEKTWVLESSKRIIWVAGLRLDDRFKVGNTNANLVQLKWHKH